MVVDSGLDDAVVEPGLSGLAASGVGEVPTDCGQEMPSADVLDLDWAPFLLERTCELGGRDDVHRNAL
ncbi:hypothetical protein ABZS86_36395 [Streptomyces sp. NPDC005355]|uniref:hypothetical protein n=1 Tax=Streptomyces sp. NPDC005355 TaxID=3157038 RepID=UPI0033BFA0FC